MSDEHKESWVEEPHAPGQGGEAPAQTGEASNVEPSSATPDLKLLPQAEIDRIADAILERQRRAEQSKRDKEAAARRKQRDDLKHAGIELTPDQERILDSRVTVEDAPTAAASFAPPPVQARAQEPSGIAEWVKEARDEVYKDYEGLKIEKSDPEYSQVDASNPARFTRTLAAALEAKKARLSSDAIARVPVLASAGGKPTTLRAQYEAELKRIRRGDVNSIHVLKVKYRSLGLTDV